MPGRIGAPVLPGIMLHFLGATATAAPTAGAHCRRPLPALPLRGGGYVVITYEGTTTSLSQSPAAPAAGRHNFLWVPDPARPRIDAYPPPTGWPPRPARPARSPASYTIEIRAYQYP